MYDQLIGALISEIIIIIIIIIIVIIWTVFTEFEFPYP
jgi:hypothetical protein